MQKQLQIAPSKEPFYHRPEQAFQSCCVTGPHLWGARGVRMSLILECPDFEGSVRQFSGDVTRVGRNRGGRLARLVERAALVLGL